MKRLVILVISIFLFQELLAQEGNYAEVNGVKLYYEIQGEGEPLVLLHGNTMTIDMWKPWLDDLSKSNKVITVDLRGHGKSTNPTDIISHREHALDIYGLLEELEIEKFSAMGFSSGGMTLINMATMQTNRIQSLVLIGAAPYFTEETREYMQKLTYEYVTVNNKDWMEYMRNFQPGGEKQIRRLLKVYTDGASNYNDMNFTPPYLSTISCSTLIINGDQDIICPMEIPMVLHESIPNSNLWIIPKFGHSIPQFGTELGDLFLSTITNFMAGG
ncbi:alpha/beta hydrolase [Aurantibacter sp.]|uniref:alpha/beta fold hydrolase n=1 Tax=Aurantibacter sp. TaxID=2807103 RepID=UPI003266713A